MSLSRTEEMHRLTENVYKVSPAPPARSGPTRAAPGPRGFSERPRRPGAGQSVTGGRGRPRSDSPALPPCAPLRVRPGVRGTGPSDRSGAGRGPPGIQGFRVPRRPSRCAPGGVGAPWWPLQARLRKPLGTFLSTGFPFAQLLPGQSWTGPQVGGRARGQVGRVDR